MYLCVCVYGRALFDLPKWSGLCQKMKSVRCMLCVCYECAHSNGPSHKHKQMQHTHTHTNTRDLRWQTHMCLCVCTVTATHQPVSCIVGDQYICMDEFVPYCERRSILVQFNHHKNTQYPERKAYTHTNTHNFDGKSENDIWRIFVGFFSLALRWIESIGKCANDMIENAIVFVSRNYVWTLCIGHLIECIEYVMSWSTADNKYSHFCVVAHVINKHYVATALSKPLEQRSDGKKWQQTMCITNIYVRN